MATLTNEELKQVFFDFMRTERPILRANGDLEKSEVQDIFIAARTFLQDHDSIYNGTIPNPPRGQATISIKAMVLGYVAIAIGQKEAGQ
jgi:hypothetical protein